jgi:hypothetical protein
MKQNMKDTLPPQAAPRHLFRISNNVAKLILFRSNTPQVLPQSVEVVVRDKGILES